MISRMQVVATLALALWTPAWAHHGGASLSQGAGTPIETNTPLTLPQGTTIVFTRAELVSFKKFAEFEPNNTDSFRFYQVGVSHGLTDFLSVTAILPYNVKTQDNNGTFRGFGDGKVLVNLGLHYTPGEGVDVNGPEDVAVNLTETDKLYFGFYGGLSMPSGNNKIDLGAGIEPGLQPGFGSVNYTLGTSVIKSVSKHLTLAADVGYDVFTSFSNSGDKFGNEFRANLAGVYRLHSDDEAFIRQLDGVLELNYLQISRDETDGQPDTGTGGKILYVSPGVRFQAGGMNFGILAKLPVWHKLNEASLQQGSEGLEHVRLIFTASRAF
ncbi:MAG: transporter [Vulcanimicrobiota bacterium]